MVNGKSHKVWDMLLLLPRLDVEADVDEHTFLLLRAAILEHELAGHGCGHTRLHFKHDVDLLLSEVLTRLFGRIRVLLIEALYSLLTEERIMHLGGLTSLVEAYLDVACTTISAQTIGNQAISVDLAD